MTSTFPGVLREDGEAFAGVFARAVAASFPVTGASSAFVYRFDPATDSFQRVNIPLGPVFSERARTVGGHKLDLAVNYTLVQFDTIDGHDLNALVSNDPRGPGYHIAICNDPLLCAVQGVAQLDLEAQIVALSATYGITPDLDVNLLLPLVRTFVRVSTAFTYPDPRVSGNPAPLFSVHTAEASSGVGDLLVRFKYELTREALVDLAGGLILSLPTGERANFHGTGDTLVGAALYASHIYAERVEPHVNLSFVLNADKLDRSKLRYSVGADVRVLDRLTLNSDFIGRSDIAQSDPIDRPVFPQIHRSDVLQFSTGLKVAPLQRTAAFVNVLLPLNSDGLRSDRILVFGLEAVF